MVSVISVLIFAQITFNNQAHSGRIKIDMEQDVSISECRDWEIIGACECLSKRVCGENHSVLRQWFLSAAQALYLSEVFDSLIIVTCITSFILCTRSVISGFRLQCVSKLILGHDRTNSNSSVIGMTKRPTKTHAYTYNSFQF